MLCLGDKSSTHKEGWAPKTWCFWTVVPEKILECPLDCKEIKPVNPKGNQPWIFIGRTDAEAPIFWPPDAKRWLTGKDADAGKGWGQKERKAAEDEMVGWHHRLNRHEFETFPSSPVFWKTLKRISFNSSLNILKLIHYIWELKCGILKYLTVLSLWVGVYTASIHSNEAIWSWDFLY